MLLSDLNIGDNAYILRVNGSGRFRRRLIEMGFLKGQEIRFIRKAPLGDPFVYKIMNSEISLRKNEAQLIEVVQKKEIVEELKKETEINLNIHNTEEKVRKILESKISTLKVALIGNPNTGKTSFFNFCTGLKEHVANYAGVTVELKKGQYKLDKYTFEIIDLPGTYSLSSSTNEERFVKNFLLNENYDVIVNIIDVTNLERNLYLTTQLLDMDIPMVVALNMYDELIMKGDKLNTEKLSKLLGVPCVPTVSSRGRGIVNVFREIIKIVENKDIKFKHIHIDYGEPLENSIKSIQSILKNTSYLQNRYSTRFLSVNLFENDIEVLKIINQCKIKTQILQQLEKEIFNLKKQNFNNIDDEIINKRYFFISGVIKNVLKQNNVRKRKEITKKVDNIVTHKFIGIPIFLAILWIIFQGTFYLGKYPVEAINKMLIIANNYFYTHIENYFFKDVLTNGIITGLGNVIIYLPNIIILFTFLSILEDIGYLPRIAFIMDKVMHKINLHGKSFIPIFLGFGCSVPAIIATRTIENKSDRLVTILITPFISCSARLPIFILLISTFFKQNHGTILFIIYITSILITGIMAIALKKIFFKKEEIPFIMELPPYRMPTLKNSLYHLWVKIYQYLKRMAPIIFIASLIIWFLKFFPYNKSVYNNLYQIERKIAIEKNKNKLEMYQSLYNKLNKERIENSFLSKMGKIISPIFTPLGFDWKLSVSLITGLVGKETIISTMAILYVDSNYNDLSEILLKEKLFTLPVIWSLLFFILLYTPCIGTLTVIFKETGSLKYIIISFLMNFSVAWFFAFLVRSLIMIILP